MQRYKVYFIWKLLYMFRAVPPPIIMSANNCIYSIWYLSHRYYYLPLQRQVAVKVWQIPDAVDTVVCAHDDGWWYRPKRQVAVTVWQIPDAVDTVVCAHDDGWWYRPKHVEQFPDKINGVTLHLVGYILEQVTFNNGKKRVVWITQQAYFDLNFYYRYTSNRKISFSCTNTPRLTENVHAVLYTGVCRIHVFDVVKMQPPFPCP
jgi:hypothetical protein